MILDESDDDEPIEPKHNKKSLAEIKEVEEKPLYNPNKE